MADPPRLHREFLSAVLERLQGDRRLVGAAIGGSYLSASMDEFSDLDLVVAVEPADYAEVMSQRQEIAGGLGPLLAAFTGEHVGEPRVLICLYGPPLLHVDLKFVRLEEAADRVEDPEILWQRGDRLSAALAHGEARYPQPDPQWIEDRFWVWVHYGAAKIGRGELFEALGFLAFLRERVLGPLALQGQGATPCGVRKLEIEAPEFARNLRRTVAEHDAASCAKALQAAVELYRDLRSAPPAPGVERRSAAEEASMDYLAAIERGVST